MIDGTAFVRAVRGLVTKLLALKRIVSGAAFNGALKRSSPRMNSGAPTQMQRLPSTREWLNKLVHASYLFAADDFAQGRGYEFDLLDLEIGKQWQA